MPVVSVTELSVLAGIYSVHFLYEPCYDKHRTCWEDGRKMGWNVSQIQIKS